MPLIRYRTGDTTRILPGPCPCGSETARLDRIERKTEGLSAAALDEILFADPALADCRYERCGGELLIRALTCGELDEAALRQRLSTAAPALKVSLSDRRASPFDRALYPGKRTLLSAD